MLWTKREQEFYLSQSLGLKLSCAVTETRALSKGVTGRSNENASWQTLWERMSTARVRESYRPSSNTVFFLRRSSDTAVVRQWYSVCMKQCVSAHSKSHLLRLNWDFELIRVWFYREQGPLTATDLHALSVSLNSRQLSLAWPLTLIQWHSCALIEFEFSSTVAPVFPLKRPSYGRQMLANSSWQTQIEVCVNDTTTCGQTIGDK